MMQKLIFTSLINKITYNVKIIDNCFWISFSALNENNLTIHHHYYCKFDNEIIYWIEYFDNYPHPQDFVEYMSKIIKLKLFL